MKSDNDNANQGRRRFLTVATTAVTAVGAGFVAVPFIKSWQPSAKAKAIGAPVEVDISKLEFGQRLTVTWRGKPVWVVRRSEDTLSALSMLGSKLRDPASNVESQQPEYAANQYRSIKPEFLVLVGICTHLGCSPSFVRGVDSHSLGSEWRGGFFCPCHGSRFDLAGRVFQGVPAPTNLVVPPHAYLNDSRILIGVDQNSIDVQQQIV
uniref:Ubiquinol-cytochrome c reductase iron-sulfur subunit n=1 Tax=Candidatus Kentrum sp. LFY TaxID=2126342 RepID=A0A450X2X8_9GAMM|nr:MAG: ubiquinol-cytochrome c reductase iron-sulfur subunit [Candidatus Kentron sp. LFY]VFJ98937.1 MAG: ubiquinol-cytochrome c reductase iron-sulfur subunit [Candidatus Kentron sp. LFY]VFK23628.1 MAG: ubiquinol-cytochrome c reductase iron-sulfur subunit [Candidatus Kentron sp. LFY]